MKTILNIGAALGLILTIVPSIFVAMGKLEWQTHANLMTAGMLLWFVTVTLQTRKKEPG
jgi:hypothetical protein